MTGTCFCETFIVQVSIPLKPRSINVLHVPCLDLVLIRNLEIAVSDPWTAHSSGRMIVPEAPLQIVPVCHTQRGGLPRGRSIAG